MENQLQNNLNNEQQQKGVQFPKLEGKQEAPKTGQGILHALILAFMSSMGTGILTIQQFFYKMGIIQGIFVLALICSFYFISSDILIDAFIKTPHAWNLNDLFILNLGPHWKVIYNVTFFVYLSLGVVSLLVTINKTWFKSLQQIRNKSEFLTNWQILDLDYAQLPYTYIFIISCLLSLTVIPKKIQILQKFSSFSFFIYSTIIIIIVSQTYSYYIQNQKFEENKNLRMYNFCLQDIFSVFGLGIFTYNCLTNFFMITSSFDNPTWLRQRKVYFTNFTILFFVISITGICGYITFGNRLVQGGDLIIFWESITETDYLMTTAWFMFLFSLFVFGGLKINPIKILIFQLTRISNTETNNIVVSVSYCILIGIISHFFKNVSYAVLLAGSSIGIILIFIFPIFLSFKTNYCQKPVKKMLLMIYMVFIVLLMFTLSYRAIGTIVENWSAQK